MITEGWRHTLAAEGLALGDLSHEECFFLLKIGRESLILGSRQGLPYRFPLYSTLCLILLPDGSGHPSVRPLESFSELRVRLSLVVKPHGVGWLKVISGNTIEANFKIKTKRTVPRTPVRTVPADAAKRVDVFIAEVVSWRE
jgi:hypothetical protein